MTLKLLPKTNVETTNVSEYSYNNITPLNVG